MAAFETKPTESKADLLNQLLQQATKDVVMKCDFNRMSLKLVYEGLKARFYGDMVETHRDVCNYA